MQKIFRRCLFSRSPFRGKNKESLYGGEESLAKIIAGVALVAFCGFCGYVLAKKYRLRKQFYRQFLSFNESFLKEISSSRRPIGTWLSTFSYDGEFEETLSGFTETLEKGEKEFVLPYLPEFLTRDERQFVTDYFSALGRGDGEEQRRRFSLAEKSLTESKEKAEKDGVKYTDLYVKMGVLLGLALLILLL